MPAQIKLTSKQAGLFRSLSSANGSGGVKAPKKDGARYKAAEKLVGDCNFYRLPVPEREFRFHSTRKWRFDLAWPDLLMAVEIEGGAFSRVVVCPTCRSQVMRTLKDGRRVPVREGGRHNTGTGLLKDAEKYNAAAELGWRVFRFTPKQIQTDYAIRDLLRIFRGLKQRGLF